MKLASAALAALLSPTLLVTVAAAQPTPPPAEVPPPDAPAPVEPTETGDQPVAAPVEPVAPVVAEPAKDDKTGTAGYDKGFFVKGADGKFSLKLTGRVHPYYSYTATKDAADKSSFELRRARLTFEGNIWGKDLLYKLQTDFGKGAVALRDFHFDLRLGGGDTWLRVGQWKKPFSRQQIVSSGRQELSDRAITDKDFGAGRDIGIAVRNDYEKSPELEWILGVFNGTGIDAPKLTANPTTGAVSGANPSAPVAFKPAVVGRVGINRGGLKGYSEADLEGGPLRWGVAASVWAEGDFDKNDDASQKAQVDYMVKVNGLSSTGGVYVATIQDGLKPLSDQTHQLTGFHVQAGYMVTPHVQVAGRFAMTMNELDDSKDKQEITLGGSYYGHGHDAKLQGAVRLITEGEAELGDAILVELTSNVGF